MSSAEITIQSPWSLKLEHGLGRNTRSFTFAVAKESGRFVRYVHMMMI